MKIVLDTNIYVAAALHDGLAKEVLEFVFEKSFFTLIISKEILEELSNKLSNKFKWSEERISFYLGDISTLSEIVQPSIRLTVVKRDAKDNKILECAVAGQADLIITLDQDLIKLKSFKGIAIIHPRTFTWTFPEYFKKIKEN